MKITEQYKTEALPHERQIRRDTIIRIESSHEQTTETRGTDGMRVY